MTATAYRLSTAATRMRRVRSLLIGRSRREGAARCSWVGAILAALFFLL